MNVHWIALAMTPGIGPKTFRALLERFGRPAAVFDAPLDDLMSVPRVTSDVAQRILAAPLERLEEELASLSEEGIGVVTLDDEVYPANLKLVPDAPPILFVRGELLPEDARAVAIVGSREASPAGAAHADTLARGLAERGFTIISGLAKGIDTAAHRGALASEGRTIGVLGSGIRVIHPRQNSALAEEIVQHGALLSELPPSAPPTGPQLMARDRIISGLSLAVIVVEAGEESGSLDTARRAKKQGRLVFAVEGGGEGIERLVQEGAIHLAVERLEWDLLTERIHQHRLKPTGTLKQSSLF